MEFYAPHWLKDMPHNMMFKVKIEFYMLFINLRQMGLDHVCYTYFDYAFKEKLFI